MIPVGDNVRSRSAPIATWLLILVNCGVGGPNPPIPTVGASGAISGVLGAYILTYPRARITVVVPIFLFFPMFDVPAVVMLGMWFLSQFTNGVASLADTAQTMGGVAWWAHIAGFAAGVVMTPFFRRRSYKPPWPISY